jgi:hypothetical protein
VPAWSRSWIALVAAALIGLAVGALVINRPAAEERDDPVSVGSIAPFQDFSTSTPDGAQFVLPVRNRTRVTVDVQLLALPGLGSPFTSTTLHGVRPGAWRNLQFAAPADCDRVTALSLGSVRLRVLSGHRRTDTALPLPDEGRLLLDYQRAQCASALQPLTQHYLEGVWLVDRTYGEFPSADDSYLMRFEPDGTFVGDDEGALFSGRPAVRGRWRLRDELLTIDVTGGDGCPTGRQTVWRVAAQPHDRLRLVWLRGTCPVGNGYVWLARRVLHDVGLPDRSPGVPPEDSLALAPAPDAPRCNPPSRPVRLPSGFPRDFYVPEGTRLVGSGRVHDGAAVIGITEMDLADVRDLLMGPAQAQGWSVTRTRSSPHRAEASWEGEGYVGRWALRESTRCPGYVVVQVVAART